MKTIDWKTAIRNGLVGGVIALYFSMIGMVEAFSGRNLIGDFFNMGHLLLFGGVLAAGILTARAHKEASVGINAFSSLVAGLAAGIPTTLLILLANNVELQSVFVSVNRTLLALLTFERGMSGLGLFFLATSLIALAGGLYDSLPGVYKRTLGLSLSVVVVVAVFSNIVTQIMTTLFGRPSVRLILDGDALKPLSAAVLFVVLTGIFILREQRRVKAEKLVASGAAAIESKRASLQRQVILFVGIGILLLIAPYVLGSFLSQVLFEVGRFVLLGLGLNIVVGYAGLLDLGYVAFFAFGAYTMGILTTTGPLNQGGGLFNFWLALPIVVLVSVFFGIMLGFPVLRMRGDYLAIVTLGFGEIIRILALSDWLRPIMGGAQGVLAIPSPVFFGIKLDSPEKMYYLVLAGALLVAFVSIRLRDSRLGRQWMAMREDEDVAEAMGINLVQTKLLAFAIGAGFSGLGGAIFAARLGNIFPHSFNLLISINALSLIIVGGLGSIPGVIVGAIALVGLPELLREFQEYRLLMYGILLIVMMLNRPEGFLPAEVFKRELHAEEAELPGAEA